MLLSVGALAAMTLAVALGVLEPSPKDHARNGRWHAAQALLVLLGIALAAAAGTGD